MPGPFSKIQITMSDQTRVQIQSWLRCPTMPSGLVRRARALLLLEQGERYAPTAKQVGLSDFHLRKWARRFCELGIAGLGERPRSGRPPVFPPEVALYVVKLACERPDKFGRSLSQWHCSEWNAHAHPFNCSLKSATKVMAQCDGHPLQAIAA